MVNPLGSLCIAGSPSAIQKLQKAERSSAFRWRSDIPAAAKVTATPVARHSKSLLHLASP